MGKKKVVVLTGAGVSAESGISTLPDILSLETSANPEPYLRAVNGRCRMIGCVNPIRTLLQSPPEMVREQARQSAELGFDLVGPECGVPPLTSNTNLRALAEYRS